MNKSKNKMRLILSSLFLCGSFSAVIMSLAISQDVLFTNLTDEHTMDLLFDGRSNTLGTTVSEKDVNHFAIYLNDHLLYDVDEATHNLKGSYFGFRCRSNDISWSNISVTDNI